MDVDVARTLRRADGVAFATHGDRTVLLDLAREKYEGLNEVGTRIWSLLERPSSAEEIARQLALDYDASPERLAREVTEFFERLERMGLVARTEASGARTLDAIQGKDPPGVVTCAALISLVRGSLSVFGLRRTLNLARVDAGGRAKHDAPLDVLRSYARAVATAAALQPVRARCLEQSITLYVLLRRRDVHARLRIGAQPFLFGAHAWVEHRDAPVTDDVAFLKQFVPVLTIED